MKRTLLLTLFLYSSCAFAQDDMDDMPGMHMAAMHMNPAGMYLMDMASGTSRNPASWTMPMLMTRAGSWNLMFMGTAFLVDTQQSGPRGGDKLYSPNNFMFSAEHSLWGGSLMFQTMLSLEPATITNRSYPLLFQTGETAYGRPLVDAQHPHNFVMSAGVQYAHKLGEATTLQFYYAPVGDPALGPVAYPHRASAAELPQAPISHHWQDSTHIADNVATVAVQYSWLRLEASGFYGTEPGENRWRFEWGSMNSYSGRVSVAPTKNWSFQLSAGRLANPERQEQGDVTRVTSSLSYSRPIGDNSWSTSLIWGRNHDTVTQHNLNSYLAETVYPVSPRNFLTGRWELVDKDELAAAGIWRIGAYTAGYTRDLGSLPFLETGIGANLTAYTLPENLKPLYGGRPWGVNLYLRLRLKKEHP
ncbi:MAG TPA: hypothetical protein VG456_05025 [Candidatus Sulfopaludibacter sp.]|jgi:hypothetical protein|nr:hypothetical protein [Candidatus Sulfopaludibacter sp.]